MSTELGGIPNPDSMIQSHVSQKINKTVSVSDYCNVDIDKDGGVVGIELLFVNQYENDFKFWLGLSSRGNT